ncbi:30S ribosomal protein S8 [Jimgerdemannia flammicorona]|nr:30S ribosomal protein S8 [Jimgerdemannia flammicorona]
MNLAVSNILYHQGFISSVARGNYKAPDEEYTPTTPDNIATRRLWLTLKYRDNEPVLTKMSCISKPSKKITFTVTEMKSMVSGRRAKFVEPLQPGEIAIVSTNYGVLEIHDAMAKNAGGLVLCRAR